MHSMKRKVYACQVFHFLQLERCVSPSNIYILFFCANIFWGMEEECGSRGEGKETVVATSE